MKEHRLQKAVARYLDLRKVLWCHVPNGMRTKQGMFLKADGMKAGVPDVLIFVPKGSFSGLAIELKVGRNNCTENQIKWLRGLENAKWQCHVCRSLDEAIDVIDKYLK